MEAAGDAGAATVAGAGTGAATRGEWSTTGGILGAFGRSGLAWVAAGTCTSFNGAGGGGGGGGAINRKLSRVTPGPSIRNRGTISSVLSTSNCTPIETAKVAERAVPRGPASNACSNIVLSS